MKIEYECTVCLSRLFTVQVLYTIFPSCINLCSATSSTSSEDPGVDGPPHLQLCRCWHSSHLSELHKAAATTGICGVFSGIVAVQLTSVLVDVNVATIFASHLDDWTFGLRVVAVVVVIDATAAIRCRRYRSLKKRHHHLGMSPHFKTAVVVISFRRIGLLLRMESKVEKRFPYSRQIYHRFGFSLV